MRIWSLHPKHLDSKGLVACWRETLLAKHVLLGLTKGYTNHPQLIRFKAMANPVAAIDAYLMALHAEAVQRSYKFDSAKFTVTVIETISTKTVTKRKIAKKRPRDDDGEVISTPTIPVTTGQVAYEVKHLLGKLKDRDPARYTLVKALKGKLEIHPLFVVNEGDVETWEIQ
eukprot:GILI01012915.1.p1 GENE.GILI01012915.1~~GILI01012915.1.p1  ORF type:complete len:171 (+),score=17.44 GILI01012915.1:53-565(+)